MSASVQRLGNGPGPRPLARPGPRPISRRPDDRWLAARNPGARMSAAMMAVLVVSFALHAGLIATALLADHPARPAAEKEIAVEIVHEAPPAPAPKAPGKPVSRTTAAPEPKTAPPPQPPRAQDKPKVEPEPVKAAEPPKPETPKPAPARQEPARHDQARQDPAERAVAKPVVAKPAPRHDAVTADQPKAAPVDDESKTLAALKQQLASLKAEQAALRQAEGGAMEPSPAAAIGPDSFQAIALPSTSDSGEVTGYESLVFSQLFKAKEAHRHEGLPGTAAVVFKIDDSGRLVDVAIANPSGIAALDQEALQVIREAAPFPPPPAGARHEFSANVSFVVGAHY